MKLPVSGWPSASYALCSYSAIPMPWAMPPVIWPRKLFGLTMVPTSWTATYRRKRTRPVEGSTSTTGMCAPWPMIG